MLIRFQCIGQYPKILMKTWPLKTGMYNLEIFLVYIYIIIRHACGKHGKGGIGRMKCQIGRACCIEADLKLQVFSTLNL